MTPRDHLKLLAKQRGLPIRETRSARRMLHTVLEPIHAEILAAIDDSYYRNAVVSIPFSKEMQLNLSWMADTWNDTGRLLPDQSTMFSGNNLGKRWAIILE